MAMQSRNTAHDSAAESAIQAGDKATALRELIDANRLAPDPEREIQIRDVRLTDELYGQRTPPSFEETPVSLTYTSGMPTCNLHDVTPAVIRAAFKDKGCLYIPGAIDSAEVASMKEAIDGAQCTIDNTGDEEPQWCSYPRLATKQQAFSLASARSMAHQLGGRLAVDSPRAMFRICEMFDRQGILSLAQEYLGERPAFSASKFMLWKVPGEGPATGWHQDGRFLGDAIDIASLNLWTVLSDCGEDAPGLDIVLKYFDEYIMAAEDSHFDWSVSDTQVDAMRDSVEVVSPLFKAGDMLMFDNWLLHRTGRRPGMTRHRYAIESWFFAPSVFPVGRIAMMA